MTLQEKIQFLRKQGYTQAQIENGTGIIQSSISRIENGIQQNVQYAKGVALDQLVEVASQHQANA